MEKLLVLYSFVQKALIKPFESIFTESGCKLEYQDNEIFLKTNRLCKRILIYPGMWCDFKIPDTITISDIYLKYAKPYGINKLLKALKVD